MSAASSIRAAGFSAFLVTNGEQLTRGALTVTAIVDRSPKKVRDGLAARDGKIDFTLMGITEIELSISLTQPAAGEAFLDSLGQRHRVQAVFSSDITWVCYCQVSKA